MAPGGLTTGIEWIVDAHGCFGDSLCCLPTMQRFCDTVVRELTLQVVGTPQWHQFPSPGGVTGLYLLTESHLACHTYPELGLLTLNLYCCRPRREFPWQQTMEELFGASDVAITRCVRGGMPNVELHTAATVVCEVSSNSGPPLSDTAGGN